MLRGKLPTHSFGKRKALRKVFLPELGVPGTRVAKASMTYDAVVRPLQDDVDAVRLVNNLAANSERSARMFVQVDGSVAALKVFYGQIVGC